MQNPPKQKKIKHTPSRRVRPKSKKIYLPRKNIQCRVIIDSKTCEKCKSNDDDDQFLLCDQCDDAYHWKCLDPPLLSPPPQNQEWLCPNCLKMMQEVQKPEVQPPPQVCHKCNKNLFMPPLKNDENRQILAKIVNNDPIKCLTCTEWYHPMCFSHRKNCLNCKKCEQLIRKQCPKDHYLFLEFLKLQRQFIIDKKYLELTNKFEKNEQQTKRSTCLQLKIFDELTNWQSIVRYQASLFYALRTKKLIFCDEQLYENEQMMKLNDSEKQLIKAYPLSTRDEQIYINFKYKIRKGAVGPFQIKQDRYKGFFVEATAFIGKGTIICEYAGQVCRHRDTLKKTDNDSIFTLLVTGSSQQDLNITPSMFGNMSRFICGINNSSREHLKKVNVRAVRFSYLGRIRIIFIAKKDIKKGETLFLNYNAGTYEEYPTDNFVQ